MMCWEEIQLRTSKHKSKGALANAENIKTYKDGSFTDETK